MKTIKRVVEQNDTIAGKLFDLLIEALIITSLIAFVIETDPNLDVAVKLFLYDVETFTVTIFTIEYVLRVLVADRKLKFIFSFHGIIDLLAILPFFIVMHHVDIRSIRVFRLFRLFRMLKFLRYSDALSSLGEAIWMVIYELIAFTILTIFVLYIAAVGIYYFEHPAQPEIFKSVAESLWWAMVTLTSVGYGDIYPVTAGGRLFTSLVLVVGMGTIAVPTGLISSAFTQVIHDRKDRRLNGRSQSISDTVCSGPNGTSEGVDRISSQKS